VLSGAAERIESALDERHWGRFSWLAALGVGGFTLGLMSLVLLRRVDAQALAGGARPCSSAGRGGGQTSSGRRNWLDTLTPGMQLALLIAVGTRRPQLRRRGLQSARPPPRARQASP